MKRSIVSPGFVKRTLAKLLKLDQQLGIVVDGDVASKAIAVGKYVNLINSTISGKPDGIYVATGAVSSGGTVTAADISGNAVTEGVTNDLSEQIGEKATYISGTLFSSGGTITIPPSGVYLLIITSGADAYKGLLGISATDSALAVVTYSLGSSITYTVSGMNIQFTFSGTRNTRFCLTRMGDYVSG